MVFVSAPRSELKVDRRIGGALDTPRECALPKSLRDIACNRRLWTVLAWKSSGRSGGKTQTREEERRGSAAIYYAIVEPDLPGTILISATGLLPNRRRSSLNSESSPKTAQIALLTARSALG